MFGKNTEEYYVTPIKPNIGDIWIDKDNYSIILRVNNYGDSSLGMQVSLKADNNQSNAFYYRDFLNLFFYGGKNENEARNAIIHHQIRKITEAING